jgi:hypothetical protein
MIALVQGTYVPLGATAPIAPHSLPVVYGYLISNVILNGLNWFWFSQMLVGLSGRRVSVQRAEPDE